MASNPWADAWPQSDGNNDVRNRTLALLPAHTDRKRSVDLPFGMKIATNVTSILEAVSKPGGRGSRRAEYRLKRGFRYGVLKPLIGCRPVESYRLATLNK
jgi:hypothetical protein